MSNTLRVSVVIALYLLLNSSLNMLNKWALASFFPFPLLLTTVHMMFSFVVRRWGSSAVLLKSAVCLGMAKLSLPLDVQTLFRHYIHQR